MQLRSMARALQVLLSCLFASTAAHDFAQHAVATFSELQDEFWDSKVGLWRSSMWWQSANTVEAISNLAMLQQSTGPVVAKVLERVFLATSNDTVARCDKGVALTFSGYFDDELWWGLAWLRAHHLTKDARYLNRSRAIFDDIATRSWSEASCGGGTCWQASRDPADMRGCYKNAITNELFLSHAAQLASLYHSRCSAAAASHRRIIDRSEPTYDCENAEWAVEWAERALSWFRGSGMINASSLINDGLDTFPNHEAHCLNNRQPAFTYNQGVLLSALGHLWHLRGSGSKERSELLVLAASVVRAVWNSTLVYAGSGGVLRDENEATLVNGTLPNLYSGSPGTDGLQFKSVLLRHLRYLIDQVVEGSGGSEEAAQSAVSHAGGNLTQWRELLARNGASIWETAACAPSVALVPGATVQIRPLFGYLWVGPCSWAFGGPTATTQTAALDAFIAASY